MSTLRSLRQAQPHKENVAINFSFLSFPFQPLSSILHPSMPWTSLRCAHRRAPSSQLIHRRCISSFQIRSNASEYMYLITLLTDPITEDNIHRKVLADPRLRLTDNYIINAPKPPYFTLF